MLTQLVLGKYYGECTETPRWKRGHFGSENSNILPLLFHSGGRGRLVAVERVSDMNPNKPSWTSENAGWDPMATPRLGGAPQRSNPGSVRGEPPPRETSSRSSSTSALGVSAETHLGQTHKRKGGDSRPREGDAKPLKLGRTQGMMAAGAWAARAEIGALLEAGVPSERILDAIRRGEEGEQPLELYGSGPMGVPEEKKEKEKEKERGRSSTPRNPSLPGRSGLEVESRDGRGPPKDDGRREFSMSNQQEFGFSKRALPPPEDLGRNEELGDGVDSPSSAFGINQEDEPDMGREEQLQLQEAMLRDALFRKKAPKPPKEVENILFDVKKEEKVKKPPIRVPVRKDPLTVDKYHKYDKITLELFEELVIKDVSMDLVGLVFTEKDAGVDEDKFKSYTDPRSPDTGLRYARLLRRFLNFCGESKKADVFSSKSIGGFIEELITTGAGSRTPQAVLYMLEFFSVIFGFKYERGRVRRWKKMADDYARNAPPRKPAPFLGANFALYMESVLMDESRPTPHRIAAGKWRLCAQSSLRHSDLSSTPLRWIQWCRERGTESCLGLRAKAPVTKTGPRPWVACCLGVDPKHDGWLGVLIHLVLRSHGEAWKTQNFFGCAPDGENSFAGYPCTLSTDVEIIRRVLLDDLEKGLGVPLSTREILGFRWHSAKNFMPTLMTHLGVSTRVVRHHGAWRKATDTMLELYLRESQSLVLRAQFEVLDLVRKGVKVSELEGLPIDAVPKQPYSHQKEDGTWGYVGEEGGSLPTSDEIVAASVRAVARDIPGEPPKVLLSSGLRMGSLPEELKPDAEDEICLEELPRKVKIDLFAEGMDPETSEEEDSGDGSADEAQEEADVDMFPNFVMIGTGRGKVHKPKVLDSMSDEPACGLQSKQFVKLDLTERWASTYQLCVRCFGKCEEGGCRGMCSYKMKIAGEVHRCGRRCTEGCDAVGDLNSVSHFCDLHVEDQ